MSLFYNVSIVEQLAVSKKTKTTDGGTPGLLNLNIYRLNRSLVLAWHDNVLRQGHVPLFNFCHPVPAFLSNDFDQWGHAAL